MCKEDDGTALADEKRLALDAALGHYEEHLIGPYLCGEAFTPLW